MIGVYILLLLQPLTNQIKFVDAQEKQEKEDGDDEDGRERREKLNRN